MDIRKWSVYLEPCLLLKSKIYVTFFYLDDLDEYELQDFFEDTMDTEFNTQCEDNSAIILSRLLLSYYKMFKAGQLADLTADLAKKFPPKASKSNISSSVKYKDANQAEEDVRNFL